MNLRKNYLSLYNSFEKCTFLLNKNESCNNRFEIDGIINYFWQAWNSYWRSYWISKYTGYFDVNNSYQHRNSILNTKNEKEIVYNILYKINKRKNPYGAISASFQEPTWGSFDSILNIAIALHEVKISSLVGSYSNSIKHLQITRNCTIHLNRATMNDMYKKVIPYYSIAKIKWPTDILFSTPLYSRVKTYNKWSNDLLGFLENIM